MSATILPFRKRDKDLSLWDLSVLSIQHDVLVDTYNEYDLDIIKMQYLVALRRAGILKGGA